MYVFVSPSCCWLYTYIVYTKYTYVGLAMITVFIYSSIFCLQDQSEPIMCSYKAVKVFFEVWGLQGKVESGVHRVSEKYVPLWILQS